MNEKAAYANSNIILQNKVQTLDLQLQLTKERLECYEKDIGDQLS